MKRQPPPWLRDRIEARGRAAQPDKCPRCKRTVLVGQSDDIVHHIATVDPHPLTPFEEAIAVAESRTTYDLWPDRQDSRNFALHSRNIDLAGRTSQRPVLAEHRCGRTAIEFDEYDVDEPAATTAAPEPLELF